MGMSSVCVLQFPVGLRLIKSNSDALATYVTRSDKDRLTHHVVLMFLLTHVGHVRGGEHDQQASASIIRLVRR